MASAKVSFVTLAGRAAVIADVPGEGHTGMLTAEDDPVVWSFTARGLRLLPAFLAGQVPACDELLAAVGHGQFAVTTRDEVDVITTDLTSLPDDFMDAAEAHEGVLLFVGRDVGIDGLDDERSIARILDQVAVEGRLLGATIDLD